MDTVDPGLIGLLAVAEVTVEACLGHPDLVGANRQAVRGACGAIAYARKRLLEEEPDDVRPLHGIERSLPEGDRE
jgi:hypothetical protein